MPDSPLSLMFDVVADEDEPSLAVRVVIPAPPAMPPPVEVHKVAPDVMVNAKNGRGVRRRCVEKGDSMVGFIYDCLDGNPKVSDSDQEYRANHCGVVQTWMEALQWLNGGIPLGIRPVPGKSVPPRSVLENPSAFTPEQLQALGFVQMGNRQDPKSYSMGVDVAKPQPPGKRSRPQRTPPPKLKRMTAEEWEAANKKGPGWSAETEQPAAERIAARSEEHQGLWWSGEVECRVCTHCHIAVMPVKGPMLNVQNIECPNCHAMACDPCESMDLESQHGDEL